MNNIPYQSLIDEIKKNGESAIASIVQREVESFFLDYKEARLLDYSSERSLKDSDLKNLSKAVSGFANSSGGILIFGVEDKNKKQKPFCGYKKFVELVTAQVSRITNPSHPNVFAFSVDSGTKDKGYVVVEIPKTDFAPLQTISKNVGYKYFLRSGESFVDIPHDVLAGMFGKRPNPKLGYLFSISEANINENEFVFVIMIKNFGAIIAKELWVNMWVGGISSMRYSLTDTARNIFDGYNLSNHMISVIAKDSYKMPPQAPMTIFEVYIPRSSTSREAEDKFGLYFSFGCDSSVPYEFNAKWTKSEYEKANISSTEDFLKFIKQKNISEA